LNKHSYDANEELKEQGVSSFLAVTGDGMLEKTVIRKSVLAISCYLTKLVFKNFT
jgi:MFS superfamily sulfate permease-like transporter